MHFSKSKNRDDMIFNIFVTAITVCALLVTAYPLYFVAIASVSDPTAVISGDVVLMPVNINFEGYKYIFAEEKIWTGYANTIIYTILGTFFGVTISLLAGYALSRRDLVGRGIIMKLMVFTMFFNGGLIPTYMVIKSLNLVNNPLVLIIYGTVWIYNIILARTYFQNTIPDEMLEAATLDGCSNTRFFTIIVLPLSKSIIAVISLYYAVGQWNSYFNALIYMSKREYFPLQLVLREILIQGQQLTANTDASEIEALAQRQRIAEIIKYGVIMVSSLPVICVYPFLQRYFVKGVMIGSVKG